MLELRKKILFQIILLTCVVIVFAAFFILFKKNIDHQTGILSSLKTKKFLFSQSASGIFAMKKQWEIAKGYSAALDSYAPSKEELVLIPQQVKKLAQQYSVTAVFAYGNESQASQTAQTSVQFTASVEGKENNVYSFLNELDSHLHTINIEVIDVTKVTQGIRASLSGRVQYY